MKKETAVEWIEDIINKSFTDKGMIEIFASILNKAKEIEKEQMEDIYLAGEAKDKLYYQQTYGKEETK